MGCVIGIKVGVNMMKVEYLELYLFILNLAEVIQLRHEQRATKARHLK